MLKKIRRVSHSPALRACQKLMSAFALWLCLPTTLVAKINEKEIKPPVVPSVIEAAWLWKFLQRKDAGRKMIERAQLIAAMPIHEKASLEAWIRAVSDLRAQFKRKPSLWPITRPQIDEKHWTAFREIMSAFYDKGFRSGLPYAPDGTPVKQDGVNYANFVEVFRDRHRLNRNPAAAEVCVMCGGQLGLTPHIDHWIVYSEFPLLSMCADNLTVICSTCNEAPNKGELPVHDAGSFADWFHPYLRPGHSLFHLDYDIHNTSVNCCASSPADAQKVANIDGLFQLGSRCTREFKAEYINHQDILRRREESRLKKNEARHTEAELLAYFQRWHDDLSPAKPHHEVHALLANVVKDPARVQSWLTELKKVKRRKVV